MTRAMTRPTLLMLAAMMVPSMALLTATTASAELLLAPANQEAEPESSGSESGADAQAAGRNNKACMDQLLRDAPADTPVSQLREWCGLDSMDTRQRSVDALRARMALEESSQFNPFVMTPHRRNYIMPVSYWSNPEWNDPDKSDDNLDSLEVKFQLSIKVPLATEVFNFYNIYFAYTQTSFFQAYNSEQSRPFRETNYMPELFVTRAIDWQLGPIDSELLSFGYLHQSNGRDVPTSRSWERLFASYVARTGNYYWGLRTWYRIPENSKDDPDDPRRDDNPDIEKYMGNFDLTVARPFGNHVAEIMVRNNLRRGDNKGAVQLDYTFPLTSRFKGIFQVFSGYGDSLINYDDYQNRVSIGILLTDTL
ncbi:MAG: phospholipase A [Alcanivorax sp.]|nr:phospholipase A [Alcanivorax sp.]